MDEDLNDYDDTSINFNKNGTDVTTKKSASKSSTTGKYSATKSKYSSKAKPKVPKTSTSSTKKTPKLKSFKSKSTSIVLSSDESSEVDPDDIINTDYFNKNKSKPTTTTTTTTSTTSIKNSSSSSKPTSKNILDEDIDSPPVDIDYYPTDTNDIDNNINGNADEDEIFGDVRSKKRVTGINKVSMSVNDEIKCKQSIQNSIVNIYEDEIEKIYPQKQQKNMGITDQCLNALSVLTFNIIKNLSVDLEAFAKHADRKSVTKQDVKLLCRHNPSLYKKIEQLEKQYLSNSPPTKSNNNNNDNNNNN
ncbi:hypothetical protein DLAC_03958 [Tieghemostelium lacteum]|uniref:Uncharacterized protein n=1 Tax=Tieghemostelium lacteum TaxID=361077 RepID=A0A151ZRW1_TIELA|nr:hypothetical protein DLAC_03958 [Tieghemostelium lacteum]|eukprot:KYQ96672.1 hypothetical protein DLAC_03958 [Tieghemostelium lacteum]